MVLKLSPEGHVLLVLGRINRPGEFFERQNYPLFDQPTDVAFDRTGNIYVADGYGNSRIMKFTKEGDFIKTWGVKGTQTGQFNLPHSILVHDNKVYVADRENERIQIFTTEGEFIKVWTHVGYPWGLAKGPNGSIYMTDGYNQKVLKLNTQGQVAGIFGTGGKRAGSFGWAHGIVVGPESEIFVTEIVNWRVQKFIAY
jgi:DNA-binding beta-propeller fold protein YncE